MNRTRTSAILAFSLLVIGVVNGTSFYTVQTSGNVVYAGGMALINVTNGGLSSIITDESGNATLTLPLYADFTVLGLDFNCEVAKKAVDYDQFSFVVSGKRQDNMTLRLWVPPMSRCS
jgi:hypothetical protein